MIFGILFSLQAFGQSANQYYYKGPIETQLSNIYDQKYELYKAIEVDSVVGTNKGSPTVIGDPYKTLQGSILFAARDQQTDWRVGVYRKGSIIWLADQLFECSNIHFYGASDLNLDGKVDIAVNCVEWTNTVFIGWLWIYSWNGDTGTRINAIKENGLSQLQSSYSASFGFLDLDGDGTMEIRARGIGNKADEWVYWSWNGKLYGDWPTTPKAPNNGFYPADMAKADIQASVEKNDTSFVYNYIVQSRETSKRGISEFHIDHGSMEKNGNAPEGWQFYGSRAELPIDWIFKRENTEYLIKPNEVKNGFTVYSKQLPGIYNFYIRSEHELPDLNSSVSYQMKIKDERTNSFKGMTISPGIFPANVLPSVVRDSLSSYTSRACNLGWVTNKGICRSLQATLDNVQRQLKAGKTKTAANGIQSFIHEVEAQKGKHLTSEGYGLLYFNARYLLDRLNKTQ